MTAAMGDDDAGAGPVQYVLVWCGTSIHGLFGLELVCNNRP